MTITIDNIMNKLRNNENLYDDEIAFLIQEYSIWEINPYVTDHYTEKAYTLCEYNNQLIFIEWYRGIDDFDSSDFPNQPVLIKEICSEPVIQTAHSFYDNNGNIVYNVINSSPKFEF